MLRITKIFHFEMAHAIHGYNGSCKNIHGHSYELHVSASTNDNQGDYISTPGFVMDFKEIKKLVNEAVIKVLDHKIVLSGDFLVENPAFKSLENLLALEAEPTAENLLIFIRKKLVQDLPGNSKLIRLKLYETKDSYAEWINENSF